MPWPATAPAFARGWATVAASPGQPGALGSYPRSRKSSTHGCHDSACSQSPCTKTTGVATVLAFHMQAFLEPVVRVRLVVERRHLVVARRAIERDRFGQRRIGLEPDRRRA